MQTGHGGAGDPLVGLMPPPRGVPVATRSTQSDITYRQVDEMESRASMDMEAKNSRIDNLQCVSALILLSDVNLGSWKGLLK